MKTEILYGIHPVCEALKAGRRRFLEVCISGGTQNRRMREIANLAAEKKVPIKNTDISRLNAMCADARHQGIVARVTAYPLADIAQVIGSKAPKETPPLLLLLDGLTDPQNMGALVRTACAVGCTGVVTCKDRCAPPSPAVSRASAGALEHILLVQVANLVNFIRMIKKEGFWIAGLVQAAAGSLYESDLSGPLALVVGGEGKGLRPLVRKHCDFSISIPQKGTIDSLNASVAGGVALYEAFRQRHAAV